MSLKDRTILALDILKSRRELRGLDEPKKTESKNLNFHIDSNSRFHQFIEAASGLDDAQFADLLTTARAIIRKQLEQPAGPPPLQLTEGE